MTKPWHRHDILFSPVSWNIAPRSVRRPTSDWDVYSRVSGVDHISFELNFFQGSAAQIYQFRWFWGVFSLFGGCLSLGALFLPRFSSTSVNLARHSEELCFQVALLLCVVQGDGNTGDSIGKWIIFENSWITELFLKIHRKLMQNCPDALNLRNYLSW